jgi:microcin C transport system substrate-binding protein
LPPAGYTALPYANANAPKGGALRLSALGGFDSLNPFILRGTAPPSIYLLWQPLFKLSDTDSVTAYADLARSARVVGRTVTFVLDPRARFSDGTQVTAADVVWTFNTLVRQGQPFFAGYYAGVAGVAAADAETVVFTQKPDRGKPGAGRDVVLNLAGLYVLPEHFWAGRDFSTPLRVAPVGSGPYRVAGVSFGNEITYARVENWWAAALPTDRGFDNFDTISETFFQSDTVALQAFKAGQIDARVEPSATQWATAYNFPAAQDGRVALALVPQTLPAGIQGFAFNTRRPVFADPRVRQALTLAFDFQWMDRALFRGAYTREQSFFSNSKLASSGLPDADELRLLAPFRGQVPAALFTNPFALPVTDGSGYNLPQLQAAMKLLNAAGWRVRDFRLVDRTGRPMRFEILLSDPQFERVAIPYAADLKLLGIDATVRTIDPATYQRRLHDFDFDMIRQDVPETDFPGAEQADYWGCAAAALAGGDNFTGVCSPAIDAQIAAEIAAPDAAAKTAAVHALDRLLLNQWVIVPWWTTNTLRLAWWQNRVAKPDAPLQVGWDYELWWAK